MGTCGDRKTIVMSSDFYNLCRKQQSHFNGLIIIIIIIKICAQGYLYVIKPQGVWSGINGRRIEVWDEWDEQYCYRGEF